MSIIIIIIIIIIIMMIMYCYEISIKNRFQKQPFTGVLSNSCSEEVRIICKTHFLCNTLKYRKAYAKNSVIFIQDLSLNRKIINF